MGVATGVALQGKHGSVVILTSLLFVSFHSNWQSRGHQPCRWAEHTPCREQGMARGGAKDKEWEGGRCRTSLKGTIRVRPVSTSITRTCNM